MAWPSGKAEVVALMPTRSGASFRARAAAASGVFGARGPRQSRTHTRWPRRSRYAAMESRPKGAMRLAVALTSRLPGIQLDPAGWMRVTFMGARVSVGAGVYSREP